MVLSFLFACAGVGAFTVEYDKDVYELTTEVRVDSLLETIACLSGEKSVKIDGKKDSIPTRLAVLPGAHDAALWLAERFEAMGIQAEVREFEVVFPQRTGALPLGTDEAELDALLENAFFSAEAYKMWNVVATIPGDDAYEVLLTAHYDAYTDEWQTYTPGADDNASGVAGVLEAARILSQGSWKHTLRFVLFGGEELGLFGSQKYVQDVVDSGMKKMITGVLNLDMIAYDGNEIPQIEIHTHPWEETSAEQGRMLADIIDVYGYDIVPEIHIKDAAENSDHSSFWPRLIPAMLLIEDFDDFTPFYHTTGDLIGTLDTGYMRENVKASLAWTATMAKSDAFIPGVSETPSVAARIPEIHLPSGVLCAGSWVEIRTPYTVIPVVYDASGRQVAVLESVAPSPAGKRIELPLSNLAEGIYWVGISGSPAPVMAKFVLVR